ncbi:N-acetyltransferase DgcN [Aliikangiella coralliicola]|uniref:DUF1611 domain-containing protein n=1 Tax=Aliikangiella coralliicola TaxID=2592383 RepID=A0A545UCI7_9GAMM|nr:N-acetyltransferase DgcN [Aliikangiella coralliicola]TQV87177.1 DUF1611 domain-containing protein [Aliikangiella coralliicola]
MKIKAPYLLFIGDAKDPLSIKLAKGVVDWRPELAIGEYSLPGCEVTTSHPEMNIQEAVDKGAKTFVLGFANSGGTVDEKWIPYILEAIEAGMDIASGLHQRLDSFSEISEHAKKHNVQLIDVRHPVGTFKTGTGNKRTGKRLLTVGTDCSVGKMYTALALEKAMSQKNFDVSFKATGQSGIFITGDGIAIDCVVSDFIAGTVEQLSPPNNPEHWDIIEGQGSLYHPAFAGVSLGLLHGAQPDALVLCHAEKREHMRGIPGRNLPSLAQTLELNLNAAKLTNPDARFVGISVNTSMLGEDEANAICAGYEKEFSLPCVDPIRHSVSRIVEQLQ